MDTTKTEVIPADAAPLILLIQNLFSARSTLVERARVLEIAATSRLVQERGALAEEFAKQVAAKPDAIDEAAVDGVAGRAKTLRDANDRRLAGVQALRDVSDWMNERLDHYKDAQPHLMLYVLQRRRAEVAKRLEESDTSREALEAELERIESSIAALACTHEVSAAEPVVLDATPLETAADTSSPEKRTRRTTGRRVT